MPCKSHIFPSLAHDFLAGGNWSAIGAKSTESQIISVVNEALYGLLQAHELARLRPGFRMKVFSRLVRVWIRKQRPQALHCFIRNHFSISL
jgi:hypothetical protein